MRKVLLMVVLVLIASCTERKDSEAAQITEYYKGFERSDYSQIKKTIADTLNITEGDYAMVFTPESFYEHFKWDSIFKPIYQLDELSNENGQWIATVSVNSLKFEFLKNNPLTCRHKFYFDAGKISKIENLDCPGANWELWQKERDSLVKWIKSNHPELDGFIHDLTMKGAIDYLSAIDLYERNTIEDNYQSKKQ